MINSWLSHVRQYQDEHGCTYKEALSNAKHTYQGGSQYAGYIRRLEAEKKITRESFKRIQKPSKWLIAKCGTNEEPIPEPIQHHVAPVFPAPIQNPVMVEPEPTIETYDDIDLNAIKNKPSKKKSKQKDISDQEADANRQESSSQKKAHIKRIKNLIADLQEYRTKAFEQKQEYMDELRKLKTLRQTKQNKQLYDDRIKQDVKDKKQLKQQYKNLFDYIRNNELNPDDFEEMEEYMMNHYQNIKNS